MSMEGLDTLIVIISWLAVVASFLYALVFAFKSEQPFSLRAADEKTRWLWAMRVGFFLLALPITCMHFATTASSRPADLTRFGFYQGLAIVFLIFFVPSFLIFWLRLGMLDGMNRRYDRWMKDPKYQRMHQHWYFRGLRNFAGLFTTKEEREFFEKGFREPHPRKQE